MGFSRMTSEKRHLAINLILKIIFNQLPGTRDSAPSLETRRGILTDFGILYLKGGVGMKAAYMDGINSMKFREEEIPVPQEDQVLVKIEYCGICGSDVHYYEKGRIGDFVVNGDFVLGHEVAGTVFKLGEKVTFLNIGDKVALEPGYTCGKCEFCKTGRYNLCPDVIFFATPPVKGLCGNMSSTRPICALNYLIKSPPKRGRWLSRWPLVYMR
jgi:hypothetical protein